ncbi:DUF2490 domain-containing protein [Winogradskyella forsetii]|uniref:DUF2490 domain-containing protein n=1 Tax=Winogradskyella forsetii TaxID=2686077 RepID=UPI0015BED87A|nr:DUF2490 domain-containing protein [Winogradskyella forsetii]
MKNFLYLVIVILLVQNRSNAQNSGEDQLGAWYEITSSNRISEKFSISGSFTNWDYELPVNKEHLLLGVIGINYHFDKNVSVGIGYGYGDIDSSFEINDIPHTLEHRIIEQLAISHKLNSIGFTQRFRLEQRFLEFPSDNLLKHRIRYRFKVKIPLNRTVFISTYDEIHFYLNEFDFQQNRAYLGLGFNLNKSINFDFGYARHSFKTKSFNRLSLQLNLKFDFRQMKI